ncbi:Gfo/Idh/MocA family protein [Quadrisphaera sp. DSM 44207]|uniref:Gfo/Idh/MocA family protein n=1 Tax=Quadrisphaera sp. DSM 44207 TaxID=1881057 RepID=UPI001C409BC4|nr:Gfo/Idh/MocA family oxidoreductase [Quadrisphaera sp. DSM 44207]
MSGTGASGVDGARIGLVGYGDAGRGIHARLLREAGLDVAVVATASPQRVAAAREELPGAAVVPDLPALLDARPDAVVLASPTGAHAEQVLACVAAGVPVVCDKPLAVDAPTAASLVAAAREAGVPLTVFQNRRWDDEQRTLAAVLDQDALGPVHRFERRWERWRPVPKDRWRENAPPQQGGGLLLDLGSHLVDSAVQLFGPVTAVGAEIAARTTVAEDDVFLSCVHAGGVRSHLWAASLVAAPGPRTRVLGARGAYLATGFEGVPDATAVPSTAPPGCTGWVFGGEEPVPVPTAPGAHADFYRLLGAALREGTGQAGMPVQPEDAVHVLAVLDAARLSAEQGRVVPVAPSAP